VLKNLLLAGVALAVVSTAASAADLPARTYTKAPAMIPPPVYDWTGFYFGGHIGGGWGENSVTELAPGTGAFPTGTVFDRTNLSGFLGGVQGGYNYQFSNIVLGVEGEYTWEGLSGTETTVSTVPRFLGFSTTTTSHATDLALVTGRLGYAANNWLLYVKGGGAWGQGHSDGNAFLANGTLFENTSTGTVGRSGWVVGLGVEWGFAPNWSAKLEYNHVDFGSTNVVVNNSLGTAPSNVSSSEHFDIVKAGVNYHFNWGAAPVVARY
jgi:outer membrane immunogenic protein